MAANFEPTSHLVILPLWSGFRTGESLDFKLTKFYGAAFEPNLDAEIFTVVPMASIKIASLYDIEIHERFFGFS
jgi:hypothetical protein